MRNKRIFILLSLFVTGCYANTSVQLPTLTNSIKPSVSQSSNITKTPQPKKSIKADELIKSDTKSSFNTNKEIKNGIRNAYITIIFKDENKIRWDFENYKFKSLKNENLDKINKILDEYKIKVEYIESIVGKSESELEEEQKLNQKAHGSDYPNKASIYYLSAENINVKELIEKLRKENFVLSVNEGNG